MDDPERALAESAGWTSVDACCLESLELAKFELALRRVMPAEVPAPELDSAILLAAARRTVPAAVAPMTNVPTSGGFFQRLRQWVLAPQVAMATITALAVVIGVFYFPSLRPKMEADGDTLMGVPTAESPSPVAATSPSEMGAAGYPEVLPPKPEGQPSAVLPAAPAANEPELALHAGVPGVVTSAPDMENARAEGDGVELDPQGYGGAGARQAGELVAMAESVDERMEDVAPPPSAARAMTRSAESTPSAVAPMPAAPSSAVGNTAGAGAPTPDAILAQARSLRSRGQCAAAIPLYDRWLAESTTGPRGDATMELGQCLASTGHTDRARRVYERAAATMPAIATRARTALDALGATGPVAAAPSTSTSAARAGSAAPTTEGRARATTSAAPPPASAADSAEAY